MNPSFTLLHTESVNTNKDAVCHIILVPVIDGVRQEPKEYIVNPKASFYFVMSGITKEQVEEASFFEDVWPEIRQALVDAPFVVCSAEGNSVHTLAGTIMRLDQYCPAIDFINAKAICRRTMSQISYSLNYLSWEYFQDGIEESDPVAIANRWTDLALMGLGTSDATDLRDFAEKEKIRIGSFSSEEVIPSLCIHTKPYQAHRGFDAESVDVNVNPEHPFYGRNIVFTGKMEVMTRNEARTAVVALGGLAPDNITKDTNILVVGKQDLRVVGEKGLSGKMKKAAQYKEKGQDIEIMDENDFVEALGQENIYKKPEEPKYDKLAKALNAHLDKLTPEQMQEEIRAMEKFREMLRAERTERENNLENSAE